MSQAFCPFCGKPAVAGASFCAACGKALPAGPGARPAAGAATSAPRPAAAVPSPAGGEMEFRPLVVRTLFEAVVSVLTLGIAWVFLWFARMGLRYRITSERIETREGVFSVRSRFVELFRVEDFEIDEPFFLRMRGAGHLVIRSMDKDEPVFLLLAVPNVREVFEYLRARTRSDRRSQNVRVVEGLQ